MKERPILFSAPMVRALLDGSKTQTRRVVKPQPEAEHGGEPYWFVGGYRAWRARGCTDPIRSGSHNEIACPYGKPGDRLWVRETFYAFGRWETRFSAKKGRDEWHFVDMTLESGKAYLYPASDSQPQPMGGKRHKGGVTPTWWKRPAIFMPSTASRITLEITEVRVERLKDISEDDALAEGCSSTAIVHEDGEDYTGHYASEEYQDLWESINGPGSWDANPWVWAVSFKRLEQPA
jgi:hypothetical protein